MGREVSPPFLRGRPWEAPVAPPRSGRPEQTCAGRGAIRMANGRDRCGGATGGATACRSSRQRRASSATDDRRRSSFSDNAICETGSGRAESPLPLVPHGFGALSGSAGLRGHVTPICPGLPFLWHFFQTKRTPPIIRRVVAPVAPRARLRRDRPPRARTNGRNRRRPRIHICGMARSAKIRRSPSDICCCPATRVGPASGRELADRKRLT